MEERRLDLWQVAVVGALGLLAFGGLWELAVGVGWIDAQDLPPPSRVLADAADMVRGDVRPQKASIFTHVFVSARRVLGGFLLSVLVGVPLGLLMGMSPVVRAALNPVVSVIRPLPALSWIPLSMIWLGIGEKQKYAIVFMGCFASVLVYTVDATLRVDTTLQRAARNLGASRAQVVRHVVLPGALPNILSGLKVVLAIAWTCVVSAEMVGASRGLGALIWQSKESFQVSWIFVGMAGISVTVLILDVLFRGLENLLLPWQRREAQS